MGKELSEQERLERKLRDTERRYQAIVDNAPDAIVVMDVETGRFCEVNQRALELFGRSREEFLQIGPSDMSPPTQPDGRPSAPVAGEMLARAIAGESLVFEWVHCNKQGEPIPCEVRLVRMPFANRILVRGSVVDISERRKLEEEMSRCRERCHTLVTDDLQALHDEMVELCSSLEASDTAERVRMACHKLQTKLDDLLSNLEPY
jgi:PAS domain S-box-containing protein